jgi:NAD(P)-dependent dehydrogenase (short-subunit alcohol dehydrogenase family)
MAMTIAIVGASGAIGAALADRYRQQFADARILRYARRSNAAEGDDADCMRLDLLDEASISAAAGHAAAAAPLDRLLVCTGVLHEGERKPEKTLRELDAAWLQHNFAVNSIGPALVLKHFLPLLRRDGPAVVALLSARVGSIGDNRLGGWYSYRASKAALNMLIATAAIELRRTHAKAALVGLHPGTVDSALSAPFQTRLREGQLQAPAEAAAHLLQVIEAATPQQSGRCLAWDGSVVPF